MPARPLSATRRARALTVGLVLFSLVLLVGCGPSTYAGPVILVGTQDGSVIASRLDTGAVVWQWGGRQTVDALVSSADIVYVTAHPVSLLRGNINLTRLTARRLRDGTQLWQVTEPQLQGYTVMALDGNALVVASNYGDGTVYGLDARSGQARWTSMNTASRTGLLIDATGGLAYIDGISQGFTALDDRTGKTVWTYRGAAGPAVTAGTNGPTIVPASGGQLVYYYLFDLVSQYAPSTPAIVTFDAATGRVRATLPWGRTGRPLWVTPDGTAYTARNNQLCALQIAGAVPLWCAPSIDAGTNFSLRLARASGILFYSRITNGAISGSPVEVGALDNATGRPLWTWQGPASLYSASNSMSLADGHGAVYLATRHGLYAFQASTGTLLWHTLASHDLSFIQPALAR